MGAADGKQVVVTYSATLNEDAVVGIEGNPNDVYLVYTRSSGTADKGETPKDTVKVFTYLLTVNKVAPDGKDEAGFDKTKPLTGAAFKLSKLMEDGSYKTVSVIGAIENEDGTYTLTDPDCSKFEWKGIDDGSYKLEEVVTPTGYNTMEPIEFWVRACHDSSAEIPSLHYVNSNYEGFVGFYPAEWMEVGDKVTGYVNKESGELTANIVNKPGTVLPSTGGMGTSFIYILGSVMVIVAGVLLVAKRRVQR